MATTWDGPSFKGVLPKAEPPQVVRAATSQMLLDNGPVVVGSGIADRVMQRDLDRAETTKLRRPAPPGSEPA